VSLGVVSGPNGNGIEARQAAAEAASEWLAITAAPAHGRRDRSGIGVWPCSVVSKVEAGRSPAQPPGPAALPG
jgi:hypothetical protein